MNKKLIINPNKKSINNLSSLESGFIFYISYYTRNYEINVDKIPIGKSIEIGYKKVELPINLYSKLDYYNMDYNIAITFKDINIDKNGEYQKPPLNIYVFILKESTIYKLKENSDLSPLLDLGINAQFDIALGTSLIYLSKNIIKDFNIEDNPNIYLSINENENSTKKYDKFNIGITIHEQNDTNILSENVYHFEKYNGNDNSYRLKIDKNKPYMKCEISFNNEYLNFSINTEIGRLNRTDIIKDSKKLGGKIILFLNNPSNTDFLFLNIFRVDNNIYNQIFLNYVFKYNNIESFDDIIKYKILNNNNELIIDEGKEENIDIIKCTFNKIDIIKNIKVNITYFLKVIDNNNYIREESLETISFTESPYYAVYAKNPNDNNGNITLIAKGNFNNILYLQVIAQIQEEDNNLIYLSYKGLKYIRPNPEPEEEEEEEKEKDKKENISDDKVYIIVISIIGGIILIVTVFIIFHICRRRRFNNSIDIKDIGVLEPRQMDEKLVLD